MVTKRYQMLNQEWETHQWRIQSTKLHIMVPKADVFFHDMLTRTLDNYYYDWEATLEYRYKEYSHPLMDSY
jgi:type IV secretory pathway component VirB8